LDIYQNINMSSVMILEINAKGIVTLIGRYCASPKCGGLL